MTRSRLVEANGVEVMAWAYKSDRSEMERPDRVSGIHIDGPLTVEDLKVIIEALVEELVSQAMHEAEVGVALGR
jgi:hypothetical protein